LLVLLAVCSRSPDLPPLPVVEISRFQPAVRDAISKTLAEARSQPNDAAANGKLGMLLHAHRLHQPAAVAYRRAAALAPRVFAWTYCLGVVQAELGDRKAAVTSLEHALGIDQGYQAARLKLAEVRLAGGDAAGAELLARTAGNTPRALYLLGRAAALRNDDRAAVGFYQAAVNQFPQYAAAHYALGQAYAKLGDTRRAKEHLELQTKAGQEAPTVPDPVLDEVAALEKGSFSLVAAGVQLARAGKLEEAAQTLLKALRVSPGDASAHANLVIVYGQMGRVADAEKHYRHALDLNPNTVDAYFNWAMLQARRGQTAEAGKALRRVLEIEPRHAEALLHLGALDETEQRLAPAEKSYRDALRNAPDLREAHFRLGRLLLMRGDARQSVAHLETAAQGADTVAAQAYYGLAVARKAMGDSAASLTAAQTARQRALALGLTDLARAVEEEFRLAR
jgi:tetratricopeptide (TPR) repeat protein